MKNLFYKSIIVLFCCMVLLSPCLVQAAEQEKAALGSTQFRFVKVRPGELTKRNINWEKVPGAEGYELYIADSKDGEYRLLADIENGSIENYVYGPEPIGGVKYYKIRPYVKDADGSRSYGEYSEVVSNAPAALASTQFRFVKVRPGELTKRNINWEKVPGAEGYELYVADSKDGAYRLLADIKGGSTENYVYGPEPIGGVKYYKVRAYAKDADGSRGYGEYSEVVSNAPVALVSTQFRFVKARPGDLTRRNINWEKVPGASGYELYIANSKDGAYRLLADIGDGNIENYVYGPEPIGGVKYYKVRPYVVDQGKRSYGAESRPVCNEAARIPTTRFRFVKVREGEETKRNINWEKLPNVSGYEIYYAAEENGNYTLLADISNGQIENYVYGPEPANSIKYYKVRAYQKIGGKKYYGEFSAPVYTQLPTRQHIHYHQGDAAWGFSTSVKKNACVVTATAIVLQNNGVEATPRTVYDRNGCRTPLHFPTILSKFGVRPVAAVSASSPYYNGFSDGRTYIKNPAANGRAAIAEALTRNPEGVLVYFSGNGSHAVVAMRNSNGTIYYSDPGRVAARGHNVTLANTWVGVGHGMGYGNLQYIMAID